VIAWRESRDRAQLSRSREEQRELFIFFFFCWKDKMPSLIMGRRTT
jgi:hypothetical protein